MGIVLSGALRPPAIAICAVTSAWHCTNHPESCQRNKFIRVALARGQHHCAATQAVELLPEPDEDLGLPVRGRPDLFYVLFRAFRFSRQGAQASARVWC